MLNQKKQASSSKIVSPLQEHLIKKKKLDKALNLRLKFLANLIFDEIYRKVRKSQRVQNLREKLAVESLILLMPIRP